MAFDPETGRLIDADSTLPPSEILIIAPRLSEFMAERGGERIAVPVRETLPMMSGGWADHIGLRLDLTGCSALIVSVDRNERRFVVESDHDVVERPMLIGGGPCPITIVDRTDFVFQGSPPILRLPLPERAGQRFDPAGWTIRVRSIGETLPPIDSSFFGNDPLWSARVADSEVRIDLSSSDLLGSEPVGTFEITARALGLDARFEILCLPRFSITRIDRVLMPMATEATSYRLHVESSLRCVVSSNDATKLAVREHTLSVYDLDLAPGYSRLPLLFTLQMLKRIQITFSCEIALRQASWRLLTTSTIEAGHAGRPIALSRDVLEQESAPILLVLVSGTSGDCFVRVQLLDAKDRTIYEYLLRPVGRTARFSLREAVDTVRSRADARIRVVVTIETPGHAPVSGEAAIITRSLRISNIEISEQLAGLVRRVTLTWDERNLVTNRVVRVWPLWRVWDQHSPVEEPIPDDAHGSFTFQKPRPQLPAGAYRIEISVKDPWRAERTLDIPKPNGMNCVDVRFGTDDEVDEYIDELSDEEPRGILERFLATRNPAALDRLAETLDPHEVEDVVRATIGFIRAQDLDAMEDVASTTLALDVLRPILLQRVETLRIIANLAGVNSETDNWLRRLVVELGLLRTTLTKPIVAELTPSRHQALWRLWTPLILALDGDGFAQHDEFVTSSAEILLGPAAVDWLEDQRDDSGRRLSVERPFRFQGTELTLHVAQLRSIRESWAQLPAAKLDEHAWTLDNLAWVIRALEDHSVADRATPWLNRCRRAAQEGLVTLCGARLKSIVDYVDMRQPTASESPLAWIPFTVGATALIERATAHGLLREAALLDEARHGFNSPREAFVIAPELYTRDLCLMDLLLICAERSTVA